MRKLFIAVISIFMVLTAANVAVLDNSKVTGYKITGETENYLELNFNVGSINYSDISTEKGAFTSVTIDGGTLTRIEGSPALPAMHELIAMPYGAEPSVEVISYDKKVYSLKELGIENPVLPAQPSYSKMTKPEDIKFIYNESSYMSSKFNDGVLAEVSKSGTMRGVGVGVLKVYPFKYNPTEGTVEVYNDLKVRVNFIGATSNAKEKAVEEYSPYFESAMAQLINYRSPALDSKADLMTYPVTYLIVAATALNGNADLNRFIAWKKQKGFNVIVNYVATTSTIFTNDAWVENQYNTLNPKPSFLLIIGDKDGTYGVMTEAPVLLGGSNVSVSDLEYGVIGTTATANRIPSIYVGRMSVRSTAELTAQVDKTLWYEKEQFEVPSPDLNYLTRTLGVAGVEAGESETHGDPQISYGWTYYFNAAHGMGNSVTYMSDTSDDPTADAEIVAFMSAGAAFYNYTAHGDITIFYDPNFTITNVNGLANSGKYPLVVGNCCLTGSFGTTECFGESWLNAENKGAIGFIGASMSTYWDEDLAMGVGVAAISQVPPPLDTSKPGMYDGAMALGYSSQAAIRHVGLMAVELLNTGYTSDYWSSYNLFGDPSLMPYFGIPGTMTATYSSTINPGVTSFSVSGTTPYAYIALSDQDGVLHGAARANSSGSATVPITSYIAGDTAKLVITAQFKKPYFADITVTSGTTPPPTPTLSSPANGSGTTDQTPTFEWSNVGGTSYTIQVDNGSGFTSPEINQTIAAVTYAPSSNLALGTYYWRVLATNSYGSSSYSSAWSFTIGTAPGTPTLASPTNGSTTGDQTPTFDWSDVSGATSYTILVDNNSDFASPEINQSPTTSTYTPLANLNYGTYYWKVLANNAYGPGAYSATWTVNIVESAVTLPLYENFNAGTTVPAGWKVVDNEGNGQVWQFGTFASGISGADGNYAYLNSDGYGSSGSQDTDLVTPLIDMTGASDVTVEFTHYYHHYTGSSATLSYSINGGTSWVTIQSWTADITNPTSFSQVITAVANQPQVKFKWNYTGSYGWYWSVDDISIETSAPNYSPVATTVPASGLTYEAATMNGTVNANGYTTTVTFEYGLTTGYGSTMAGTPGTVTGTSNTSVSASLTGLASSTTYNFRVKAVSSEGTTYGANQAFTTEAEPVLPDPPTDLAAVVNGADVSLSWVAPAVEEPDTFTDGFESYADFALTFANWTQIDGDGGTAYGSNDADFTNESYIGSYIVFNPSQTTPALTGAWGPHTGGKYAACFAVLAADAPNNDWLITPQLLLGSGYSFSFYAKSIKMDWGGDRFKVGVSTTGTAQGDFTIISAGEYVTATGTWTNYSYDLSAYAGQTVYLAIICVSNDTFVLAIDDVSVNNAKGQAVLTQNFENIPAEKEDNRVYGRSVLSGKEPPRADLASQPSTARSTLGGYKVYRNGSSIATISNPATLTYSDIGLSNGDYSYYVTATYTDPTEESGPSNVEEVNVSVSVVPGTPSNVVTSIDGNNIVIDWDVATNADSYDVYSSADPYGTFSFEANVGTNQYIVSYTDAKKFYYIVSKSGTKEAPETIEIKKADVK